MNEEVSTAIKRLDSILPLMPGLKALSSEDASLYCKLLNSYVQQGRTLTCGEAEALVDNAQQVLKNIAANKLIVLDTDGDPVGAYPFTSEEREHRVHVNGVTVHCMCALDALAVSPMFHRPTVIESKCRVSGAHVRLEQNGSGFNDGTLGAWFGIDWGAAASDTVCAESLCTEMIFLTNETVAREWLAASPDAREIFDLPSAVAFAAGFFVPLAESCTGADSNAAS